MHIEGQDIRKVAAFGTLLLTATAASAQQEDLTTVVDFPHVLSYFVAGLLIALFVLVFRNRLIVFREREVNAQNRRQNAQLALVLRSCKARVWTYDVDGRRYRRLTKDGSVEGEYSPIDFSNFFERDDFERMRQAIFDIRDGLTQSASLIVKANRAGEKGQDNRQYQVNIEVLRRDGHGQPTQMLGLQRDITADLDKQATVKRILMQYHTVFNLSLIDMVNFDADGIVTDINDKACETFGISDRAAFLASKPSMRSHFAYLYSGFDGVNNSRFTTIINPKDLPEGVRSSLSPDENIYYETVISGIHDKDGRLTGFFSAGRGVSEMVSTHHHQQEAMRRLKLVSHDIETYIRNINYALHVSEVRLVNYYPQTHLLEVSSDLSQTQYRLTQLRCLKLVAADCLAPAQRILRQMDMLRPISVQQTLRTIIRDHQGRNVWLSFSFVPVYNGEGQVDHYFGMCRNETEMVATEQQLKQETEKAQEAELLKDSFLMNMSYEIRTPLNAILGFADLLNTSHAPADEPVFVNEIKTNSNKLLALVNDVLFLSRLDANMIEFKRQPVDFALIFESYCQLGWSAALKPGVKTIIENPYTRFVVDIDDQHLGEVIQRLCQNAAYYTSEGMIRAKYEHRLGRLNITVEDTGVGIAEKSMEKIFDRVVANEQNEHFGTGLSLPIVKDLVEQMGGMIEVTSEQGKGTTAWVSIPCELTELDKKKDILV